MLQQPGLYGGTVELLEELQAYGIRTTYVKENSPEAFQEAILPEKNHSSIRRDHQQSQVGCDRHQRRSRGCT